MYIAYFVSLADEFLLMVLQTSLPSRSKLKARCELRVRVNRPQNNVGGIFSELRVHLKVL